MKTLYSYSIKTGNGETFLQDNLNRRLPISGCFEDAERHPEIAALFLRDLAKWAIEQAEIVEELELNKPIPPREPFARYKAVLAKED